jgi:hypothetical protein
MQKTFFFCKSSDIANKMLVIIHANKINAKKNSVQNLEPLALKPIKTKCHLTMYLHQFIQR